MIIDQSGEITNALVSLFQTRMTTRKRLFDAGGRRRPLVFLTFSFCLISLALGQTCPTSGAVSITSDCTYTAGTYSLSSLSVSNSATVTFVGSDFTATTGTTLNVAGSVTINSGSTLSAPDSGTFYLYTEGINSLIDPFLTYEGKSAFFQGKRPSLERDSLFWSRFYSPSSFHVP